MINICSGILCAALCAGLCYGRNYVQSFFIVFLTLTTCVWLSQLWTSSRYTNIKLRPGMRYTVNNKLYEFPSIKVSGSPQLLRDDFISKMRDLITKVDHVLTEKNIQWFAFDGTLLGAVRHNTVPMHFDDDSDIYVDKCHREYLYSKQFRSDLSIHGLKSIFLPFHSKTLAKGNGTVVRVQHKDDVQKATLDIFFYNVQDEHVKIIDGWSKDTFYYKKYVIPKDIVFPLVQADVDNINLWLPKEAKKCLKILYSEDVLDHAKVDSLLLSLEFPYMYLEPIWT